MENTELLNPETAQAMYEIAGIVITLVISMVGMYIRNFLQTNKKAIEYNLNNDRTERILANALAWAEAKSLEYVDKTMWVVLVITMGSAFGLAGVSTTFAPVYWGEEFRASSQIIAGMTPALVFSAFGNVIRTQFLIPRSFDKEYTVSLVYGAVINIVINILLIPRIGAMGAVVGTIVTEMVLCVYQTWIARKYLHIREYLLNAGVLFMIGMVMYAVLV